MLSTPTSKYGVLITTVDPTQNIIEGVLKTGGTARIAMFNKPAAFRWPDVGEAWMARQENGTWILDGLMVTTDDLDTFVAEPGDLVLNSATGRIVVTGGTEVVSVGGDIGGTGIDPEVIDLHLTPTALTDLAGDLAGALAQIGAWTAPTLINSWATVGGVGIATPAYRKDAMGFVHLKGRIKSGANGTQAFVLPAGFRPGATDLYPIIHAGTILYAAVIDSSGNVSIFNNAGSVATDVSLGGITFLAEN